MDGLRRKFFFAVVCLTLALLIPANLAATAQAQSTITVTAQAGLGGFCKTGNWLPVRVTVNNTGADVNARVQSSFKNSGGGTTIEGMDVSLPSTSRKEFFLYIRPESFLRTFSVSVTEGNKVLATTNLNINCLSDPTTLFGVITDSPSTFSVLNSIRPLTGAAKTAQLKIDDLPDHASGWGMLDALIISNADSGTLTVRQKQALELWIANGGKLFVTGGLEWQTTTAGISDLLPLQINGTKNITSLSALSDYTIGSTALEAGTLLASGKVLAGSNVLVQQNGTPLLVEKPVGFGKVYFFAADPSLKPLSDWDGFENFYLHLIGFKSPKPLWASGRWDAYYADTALSTLPELSLPSFIYVCCWLGLYIAVIGPLNYFILRRIKRPELAWVTIPVLVIVFTSLAYFSGYLYRGTRPILNRIMLAQTWEGVDQSQVTGMVGLYSPTRTTYDLKSGDDFLLMPYLGTSPSLQGGNDWLAVKNDAGYTVPDVRVEIGGMQSISAEGSLPTLQTLTVQHDLVVNLSNRLPKLSGKITNTSSYTLRDATLVTPSGWTLIGDIAPNETRKVSSTLANSSNTSLTNQYTILNSFGWDPYAENNIPEQRRYAFLQAVTTSTYGYVNVNTGVYLMGWVDNEISVPVDLQGQESNSTDTLLFFQKLNPGLQVEPGNLMLSSSIYSWESTLGDSITSSYYNLSAEGYTIRFQPSLPVHFSKVDSLQLNIGTNTTPDKIILKLWDHETGAWIQVDLQSFNTKVPNAARFVGMDGEIRMNITGNQNDYFEITAVDFTLMVQP